MSRRNFRHAKSQPGKRRESPQSRKSARVMLELAKATDESRKVHAIEVLRTSSHALRAPRLILRIQVVQVAVLDIAKRDPELIDQLSHFRDRHSVNLARQRDHLFGNIHETKRDEDKACRSGAH